MVDAGGLGQQGGERRLGDEGDLATGGGRAAVQPLQRPGQQAQVAQRAEAYDQYLLQVVPFPGQAVQPAGSLRGPPPELDSDGICALRPPYWQKTTASGSNICVRYRVSRTAGLAGPTIAGDSWTPTAHRFLRRPVTGDTIGASARSCGGPAGCRERREIIALDLILLVVLLLLSAAFSGTETAFFSLGVADLARLRGGDNVGRRIVDLIERSHDLLSALLIGNLLVNTAAGVVTTAICLNWFGAGGVAVAIPVATIALLLFGEITPKMLALRFREPVARVAQAPLRLWLWLIRPVIAVITWAMESLLRALPYDRSGTRSLTTAELQTACDLAVADGTLSETEGRSLARLLLLEDLEVHRIMTPRTEVVTLRSDRSLRQVLATARRAGYNRYPVTDAETGKPVGLFHLKDLLSYAEVPARPVATGLRRLLFVPESKDVAGLLGEMRGGDTHLAAVVDEHGDFTGIVTMADCLQALMGPVADTGAEAEFILLGEGRWVIAGRTGLQEFRENCGIQLPESHDYVTVAGFMMARLGRVLQPGDRITLPRVRLTALDMTGHRVDRIQVTALREPRRSEPAKNGGGS